MMSILRFPILTAHMRRPKTGDRGAIRGEKQRQVQPSIPTCQFIGALADEPGATPARFCPCISCQRSQVWEHGPSRRMVPAAHRFVQGLALSVNTQLSSLLTCQMLSLAGIDVDISKKQTHRAVLLSERCVWIALPDAGALNRSWNAGLADRLIECHPGCLVSCKRFDGGCVSACLVASAADQSPL